MLDLSTLACEQVEVTLPEQGETLTRFAVGENDVLMADRGLAHRRGIRHVVTHGGDVIVRMNWQRAPGGREGATVPTVAPAAHTARWAGPAWPASMRDEHGTIGVRVCALKKSAEQTRKGQEKLRQIAAEEGRTLQPDTLEAAGYVIVLSTLHDVPAQSILELYRYRWQIELAFKRLKSLLHLGHSSQKTDPVGAKAWLQGKLFVATLIETLIAVGERFSPWGYFLAPDKRSAVSVA